MDTHDFSEFYMMCGPVVESELKKYIKLDIRENIPDEYIVSCVNYLCQLDDINFERIYLSLPSSLHEYNANAQKLYELNNNQTALNPNNELIPSAELTHSYEYSHIEYARACISNNTLLHKCLAISKIPIFNSLIVLKNAQWQYLDIDLDCCKLLTSHEYNVRASLLELTQDYDTIRYIIDGMSNLDLYNVLNSENNIEGRLRLYLLLLIDKIYIANDKCLNALLRRKIMSFEDEFDLDILPLIRCYYIIKYLTIDEGKAMMKLVNKYYDDARLGGNTCMLLRDEQQLHNAMLEFHFTPRGGHTKGARS
jgi:hypothetical protein